MSGAADILDVLVIGGGQAGIPLAHGLAGKGMSVALAERRHLGGSCVNFGCTPTKAAIASARVAHLARRASEYGVHAGSVTVDFAAVLARARKIAAASRNGLEQKFKDSRNPLLVRGHARLQGSADGVFRIQVGGQTLRARQVVLNTGTRTAVPPVAGISDIAFLHSGNWLDATDLPARLAMLGGGAIGLEMAQFYRRMGSEVVVLDAAGIAAQEDEDVATALRQVLEGEGIGFRPGVKVGRIQPQGDRLALDLGGETLTATQVFVATGRRPNTDDLGLESVGVAVSDRGFVQVDARLATSVPGIWAAGDIRGGPMFTHTSWDDYRVLMSQIAGDGTHTTQRVVPYAIFTDPELGRVGMTEAAAHEAGRNIRVGRFEMQHNGRAKEAGETAGLVKVVVDATTHKILGAAVLAPDGGELVHEFVALMNAGAPWTVLRDGVQIHPTFSEALQSALATIE